jgi:hypothetical protein
VKLVRRHLRISFQSCSLFQPFLVCFSVCLFGALCVLSGATRPRTPLDPVDEPKAFRPLTKGPESLPYRPGRASARSYRATTRTSAAAAKYSSRPTRANPALNSAPTGAPPAARRGIGHPIIADERLPDLSVHGDEVNEFEKRA